MAYATIKAGYTVRFLQADIILKTIAHAMVDNSVDRTLRSFLSSDLLILDDLGFHRPTSQQSADLYHIINSRHRVSSFVITSNTAVEEWLTLLDDPILGDSAFDRLSQRQLSDGHRGNQLLPKTFSLSKANGPKGDDRLFT